MKLKSIRWAGPTSGVFLLLAGGCTAIAGLDKDYTLAECGAGGSSSSSAASGVAGSSGSFGGAGDGGAGGQGGAPDGSFTAVTEAFAYCDLAVVQQASKLQENGDSEVVSSGERKKQGIRLTEDTKERRSSVYHKLPIQFGPGASLYQHFRVRISGGLANAPPNGGSGFSFVLQNDPGGDPLKVGKDGIGVKALGAASDGFGYSGITQSIALELDTLQNQAAGDPDGNHLALDIGGLTNHTSDGTSTGTPLDVQPAGSIVAPWQPVALDPVMQSLESTAISYDTRDVWIDYECSGTGVCSMKVYMAFNAATASADFADSAKAETLPKKPDAPIMVVENLNDLTNYLSGPTGFAGFSASTGNVADEHLVTYWVLNRQPLVDSDMNNLEDQCECGAVPGACSGNVPICDSSVGQGFCRDCLSDKECVAATPDKPFCDLFVLGGSGACAECLTDAHCPEEKPYCDRTTHECSANCTTDEQCDPAKWCDNPTGVPLAGACRDDLPNDAPIPTSANHTPPLHGACSPEAAAVTCQSGVCDPADDQCGYLAGGPCSIDDGPIVCRTGTCSPAGVCACSDDTDCGGATSGRVCDQATHECRDGCRGLGGNTCPTTLECSSVTADLGQCSEPAKAEPRCPPAPSGSRSPAAAPCAFSPPGSSSEPAPLLLFAALGAHLARRRRAR